MSNGYNTDLQTILKQAMSQLQTISNTNSSSIGTSDSPAFINSVWGVAQNAQTAIDGDTQQKAQASVNILQGLLSMISFSKNQQTQANKEVQNNANAINNNEQAADTKAQEVQAKIESIVSNIGNNTTNIQNALAKIEELGGEAGGFAELQAQIEAQLAIIDNAKADLNDPEKREEALQTIAGAAAQINTLIEQIPNIQAELEAQNAIVEQNVNEISQQIEESATAISQGVTDIQTYIQKGSALGAQAGQITTQGATDVPTGSAEVALGNSLNSTSGLTFGLSGLKGSQYIQDGNLRISAGQTRIQGGAQNLTSLTSSIGKMGTAISELAEFTNAIGQIGDGVTGLVDQYMSAVQPFIEAVGTWDVDAIMEANAQLQADVQSLNGNNPNTENNQKEILDTNKFRTAFGL